ncbi:chymotrypsin-1-like [Linepithema humile]|uniref:chymotrypsin-1-like n=1 Tax=Linepithema humile TaxID=83485 RepID=UPI00351DC659
MLIFIFDPAYTHPQACKTFADEPEAIVGGTAAAPGEFPWQCPLQQNGQHVCGCSIIGRDKILTAAHCVKDIFYPPYSDCRVVTGTINVKQGQSHTVKSIRRHPNYVDSVSESWVNDVAVITFNKQQSPICLADSPPVAGMKCTLSGWSIIRANGPLPTYLLKMEQALVTNEQCEQDNRMKIYPSHLCAYNKRGIGACQGDSGGPLVCNGRQYGITSWVLPCARGVPDAYTSVYHHRDFIRSS